MPQIIIKNRDGGGSRKSAESYFADQVQVVGDQVSVESAKSVTVTYQENQIVIDLAE